MSVKVDIDQLADALSDYPFAYLVTVGDDFHAHT
ncbi:MAG: pyridoxamine 5'-phosphate oxidase family protein, partial [Mycobacterium sp.]